MARGHPSDASPAACPLVCGWARRSWARLATVTSAAVDTGTRIFSEQRVGVSVYAAPGSGTAGPQGGSIFNFLRKRHAVRRRGLASRPSPQGCRGDRAAWSGPRHTEVPAATCRWQLLGGTGGAWWQACPGIFSAQTAEALDLPLQRWPAVGSAEWPVRGGPAARTDTVGAEPRSRPIRLAAPPLTACLTVGDARSVTAPRPGSPVLRFPCRVSCNNRVRACMCTCTCASTHRRTQAHRPRCLCPRPLRWSRPMERLSGRLWWPLAVFFCNSVTDP